MNVPGGTEGNVKKVDPSAVVQTNLQGVTVEQQNIIDRLKTDNEPGAIKHLYVISPFSGQVLLYSTVKGKITSGSNDGSDRARLGTIEIK